MSPAHTIVLVDASPYIFRAYFSLPKDMLGPAGRPVGAVYGFVSFLLKLIEERQPGHLGVAFDRSLTTSFRNEIYPAYKAQRELPPPALEAQLDACLEAAAALGAATFIDDRYEADDLIGTLTRRLAARGHRVMIVTSDKDLAQLVDDRVALLDYARDALYDEAAVVAKFSVRPRQIPDLLGLAGDSVDNIPGVKGIGVKSAAALLAEFEDLESLYDRLADVPRLPLRGARSIAAKLEAGREVAFLSRRLATVAYDAPAAAGLRDLRRLRPDPGELDRLFADLGFEGLRERALRLAAPDRR